MDLPALDSLIAHLNILSLASLSQNTTSSSDSSSWDQTSASANTSSSSSGSCQTSEKCVSSPPHHRSSSSSSASARESTCEMQSVRVNGRKIIGPSVDWEGEAPSNESELFLKRIPKDMHEMKLLRLFQQFGPVYNLRLMVDFCDQNRGFGYVHFVHKSDATKAMDVLQHYFIRPFHTLHLEKSYNKCRLFVSNFPRDKSVPTVKAVLQEVFPELSNVVIYKCHMDEGNRGFAFVDFPTHDAAIRAKQQTSIGRCRLFDRDVKVVWANPEHTADTVDALDDVRTLFVRNVHMALNNRDIFQVLSQFVHRTEVQKVARVRDLAFIEFFEREAAERVKVKLDGYEIMNRQLEVSWAIPPKVNTMHQQTDHDATLRMKCVANKWLPPIYVFGRIFSDRMAQYVAVLLGDGHGLCQILMQISVQCLDLQSRVAEVVVALIEMNGRLPLVNYVLIVEEDAFHLVGIITCLATATFVKASPIPVHNLSLHWSEVREMCQCCMLLFQVPRSTLDYHYHSLIQSPSKLTYLPFLEHNLRRFGCINPGYRSRPPLKHNLQCDPIVLALCDVDTGSNFNPGATVVDYSIPLFDKRESTTTNNNEADSTLPNPVRYYRVPLVANNHHPQPAVVDGWQWRKSSAETGNNTPIIREQPFCAVVYGRNVSQ